MNNEYYSSQEHNSFSEHKSFPAEIYNKTVDYTKVAEEIKVQGHEYRAEIQLKKGKDKPSLVKRVLDKLTKSMSSIVTSTVVTVTAVALSAGIISSITAPEPQINSLEHSTGADYVEYSLDVEGLDRGLEYAVIVENPFHSFEYGVEGDGVHKNLVTGLRPGLAYNMSLVCREGGDTVTYYEETVYTTTSDIPSGVFNVGVNITEEGNAAEISYRVYVSDYYKKGKNYRLEIENETQGGLYHRNSTLKNGFFTGSAQDLTGGNSKIRVLGEIDGKERVIAEHTVHTFTKVKPTVSILGAEIYDLNVYKISYKVMNLNSSYKYDSLVLTFTGSDGAVIEQTATRENGYVLLELWDNLSYIEMEAQLNAFEQNGDPVSFKSEKTRVNLAYNLEYTVEVRTYNKQDRIELSGYLPSDSIVVITDSDGYEMEYGIYDSIEWGITAEAEEYMLSVKDPLGNVIFDGGSFTADHTYSSSDFEMTYSNPGDVQISFNEDGTTNMYVWTDFFSDDPEIYYEVMLDKTYASREKVLVAENVPLDKYPIIYRVIKEIDGVRYILYELIPSGTTYDRQEPQVIVNLNGSQINVEFDTVHKHESGSIRIELPSGEIIQVSDSELVYNESSYKYSFTVNLDSEPEYAVLHMNFAYLSYHYDDIAANTEIKGAIFVAYEFIS